MFKVGDKVKIYPMKPFSADIDIFHQHYGKTATIIEVDSIPAIKKCNYYVSLDDFPKTNHPKKKNRFYYLENELELIK